MKFEFNWPSGFKEKMFENIDRRMTDRRRSDWYTISSPMSLLLKYKKEKPRLTISISNHGIIMASTIPS